MSMRNTYVLLYLNVKILSSTPPRTLYSTSLISRRWARYLHFSSFVSACNAQSPHAIHFYIFRKLSRSTSIHLAIIIIYLKLLTFWRMEYIGNANMLYLNVIINIRFVRLLIQMNWKHLTLICISETKRH